MVPRVFLADVSGWLTLLALVLGPALVATIFWSPMLASEQLRSLFRQLPLTTHLVVNYVLTSLVLSLPWLLGLGVVFQTIGSQRNPQGEVFVSVAMLLGFCYVVGLPLLAGVVLPWLGIDWDSTGYSLGTWLLLGVSGLWYSAIFAVPMILMGIIIELPF